MLVKSIIYKGKEVVYVNYRMKSQEKIEATFRDSMKYLTMMEEVGKRPLVLIDWRGVPISKEMSDLISEGSKEHVDKIGKSAILGITGIKRLFFEIYLLVSRSKMKVFDDKSKALDYLVQ